MIRLLFYTDTPMLGGTEEQMYLLAKYLDKQRFEITLACTNSSALNEWCARFMELGCKVVRLNVSHKHDPRHYLYLNKLLPDFDLLHLHLWNPASCRWALAAAKDIPTVVTEHDPFPLSGMKRWLKKILSKSVARVIVCSQAAQEIVNEHFSHFQNRVSLIPNGIDIDAWRASSLIRDRDDIRSNEFHAKQSDFVVICVAELNERKGQRFLIEACAQLDKLPHLKLILVGSGPAKHQYEKLAHSKKLNIEFLGRRNDVPALMRAADLFVLPSIREAFGLVILEAGISEVATIASNTGGIKELIKNNETGRLVKPQDSTDLAIAINEMIDNSWDCRRFVKNARDHIEKNYNAKKMAERTAEVYEEITN